MELIFNPSVIYLIFYVDVDMYDNSRRQSERILSGLDTFCHRLMFIKSFISKEPFSGVHCVFLVVCNSFLADIFLEKKKTHYNPDFPLPTFTILR